MCVCKYVRMHTYVTLHTLASVFYHRGARLLALGLISILEFQTEVTEWHPKQRTSGSLLAGNLCTNRTTGL